MFQDLKVHLVVSWHPPQLDRDGDFYHLMPQSMRWHCYSKFLRNRRYQLFLHFDFLQIKESLNLNKHLFY